MTDPTDPIDAILADIDERGRGRTRYEGQEPRRDEMMAEEVRRLRGTADPRVNLDVIRRAYAWTLDRGGQVCGLTAGDMGYEDTGISVSLDHVRAAVALAPPVASPSILAAAREWSEARRACLERGSALKRGEFLGPELYSRLADGEAALQAAVNALAADRQ